MKKIVLLFASFIFAYQTHCASLKNFSEYVLENGLRIFVLEDFSAAPVRIEYCVKAGINSQNSENAGFFPLYQRVFPYLDNSSPEYFQNNLQGNCFADFSRYTLTVAPLQVESALTYISHCAFAPHLSNEDLSKKFLEMKSEIKSYIESPASFINSSIDSRIYKSEPWKQDSGIYPPFFSNTPVEKVRSNLTFIEKNYYTPQNSAIFISGAISKEKALSLSKKIFSQYKNKNVPLQEPLKPTPQSKKKFVIIDPSFSTDITQIVVQYISLSSINADVGANIFNSYTSTFKKNVLSHTELAIRGEDYIHIASTHRSGQSRMIFQTLFEKSKFTPIEQAELFINLVKNATSNISEEEIKSIQNEITSAYNSLFSNSTSFMEKLSELWAVESFYANEKAESLLQKLISRPKEINSFNLENFRNNITQEEPFIFLLLNSAIYQKYEKKIKEKGYELITQKNSSWYLQELYKNAKNTIQEKKEAKVNTNSAKEYIEENKKQFSFFNLQNNIPCILKLNENSSTALTMISIEGGKLSTSSNPGFFSVLINALAGNIQKELNEKKMNGLLEGFPSVKANTSLTSGTISVESLASDTEQIISCITNAIIFGEIKASHADGLVYNERTKKRLYDGDLTNQLYSKAIDELYKGSAYPAIFDTDKDILVHTKYTDILSSYPVLLNAARYKIILTGNFQKEKIVKTLSSTFGLLANQNETYSSVKIAKPNFPKDKRLSVKLRHVFLTDVSKEDAGPRPLVLIPTKNFSDPVQYWIPSPEPFSNDFTIFNSILNLFCNRLENKIQKIFFESTVKKENATNALQAFCITCTKIEKTKQLDELYAETIGEILSELKDDETFQKIKTEILNTWILTNLDITQSNRGTALLIHDGIENERNEELENNAKQYILDYEIIHNATQENFLQVAENYINEKAPLRLYSKDAK